MPWWACSNLLHDVSEMSDVISVFQVTWLVTQVRKDLTCTSCIVFVKYKSRLSIRPWPHSHPVCTFVRPSISIFICTVIHPSHWCLSVSQSRSRSRFSVSQLVSQSVSQSVGQSVSQSINQSINHKEQEWRSRKFEFISSNNFSYLASKLSLSVYFSQIIT